MIAVSILLGLLGIAFVFSMMMAVSGLIISSLRIYDKAFTILDEKKQVLAKAEISTHTNSVRLDLGYTLQHSQVSHLLQQVREIYAADLDWNMVLDLIQNNMNGEYVMKEIPKLTLNLSRYSKHDMPYYSIKFDVPPVSFWDHITLVRVIAKRRQLKKITVDHTTPSISFSAFDIANQKVKKFESLFEQVKEIYRDSHYRDKESEELRDTMLDLQQKIKTVLTILNSNKDYMRYDALRQIFSVHIDHLELPITTYQGLKKSNPGGASELYQHIKNTVSILASSIEEHLKYIEQENLRQSTDNLNIIEMIASKSQQMY